MVKVCLSGLPPLEFVLHHFIALMRLRDKEVSVRIVQSRKSAWNLLYISM